MEDGTDEEIEEEKMVEKVLEGGEVNVRIRSKMRREGKEDLRRRKLLPFNGSEALLVPLLESNLKRE